MALIICSVYKNALDIMMQRMEDYYEYICR